MLLPNPFSLVRRSTAARKANLTYFEVLDCAKEEVIDIGYTSEDLPHFASCILTDADYLVSENREFLKRAEGHGFECDSPGDFLEKTTETDHPPASRS